jgi:hypothetical protein
LRFDAIHVNHEDLDEQSQQFKLMPELYTQAAKVLVWLDPALQITATAKGFFNTISLDVSVD